MHLNTILGKLPKFGDFFAAKKKTIYFKVPIGSLFCFFEVKCTVCFVRNQNKTHLSAAHDKIARFIDHCTRWPVKDNV